MMNLDAQIQLLVDNAPQDGVTPKLVAAIAPVLKNVAQKLGYSQYYILQDPEQRWVMTTLSNRTFPEVEKRVVYAYPTLQDIPKSATVGLDRHAVALPMPVIEILFHLTALEPLDSIVFFRPNGTTTEQVELERTELQNLIQQQLQKSSPNPIPPDIAY